MSYPRIKKDVRTLKSESPRYRQIYAVPGMLTSFTTRGMSVKANPEVFTQQQPSTNRASVNRWA